MAATPQLLKAFSLGLALPFVWVIPAMVFAWVRRGLRDGGGCGQ